MRADVLALLLVAASPALAAHHTVLDGAVGFDVPDDFVEAAPPTPDTVASFRQDLKDDTALVISVQRLGGIIGREPLVFDKEAAIRGGMPRDAVSVVEQMPWRTFSVSAVHTLMTQDGVPVVMMQVQLPMAHEAVAVAVGGTVAHEAEVRALLTRVVASVTGATNWLDGGQRAERVGRGVGRLSAFVALPVAVVVGIIVRRRREGRG